MAKKLKQQELFNLLKKKKVSVANYIRIYAIYQNRYDEKLIENIPKEYYCDNKLTLFSLQLLDQIDSLFKPSKKLSEIELLGPDYLEKVQKYISIFPNGTLPSGKRARQPIPIVVKKFIDFFTLFNYSWDTIIKATEEYVDEYEDKNYDKMRTCSYFIIKNDKASGEVYYDLQEYCEKILEAKNETRITSKKSSTHVF
jgi:hypothetical protein